MSAVHPQPADWSQGGAFRAAYLAHYSEEDRAILRRTGVLLARQVFTSEVAEPPDLVGHFRAALEDALMLALYLREIADKAPGALPIPAGRKLAAEADHWWRTASDLRHGMAASFQDATGEWVDGEGQP